MEVALFQVGKQDKKIACPICNNHKGSQIEFEDPLSGDTVPLYNPRKQVWHENFTWSKDGLTIIGKTPIGRATVVALHLSDDADALLVRSFWVQAGWHPPRD